MRASLYHISPALEAIAREIAKGSTDKEIAKELCLSSFTIKNHVSKLHSILQTDGRMRLLAIRCFEKYGAPPLLPQRLEEMSITLTGDFLATIHSRHHSGGSP